MSCKLVLLIILLLSLLALPAVATNLCPTDTLDHLLAIGTCSIGEAILTFGDGMNGIPEFYNGPFAGEQMGLYADQITFTPDPTTGNPGFMLSGAFLAQNGYKCDIQLGLFYMSLPSGGKFDSYSVGLINPVATGTDYAVTVAWLNAAAAYAANDGSLQVTDTGNYFPSNSVPNVIDLRNFSYSYGDKSSFDAATFHFHVQQQAPAAPEPSSLLLVAASLLGCRKLVRR